MSVSTPIRGKGSEGKDARPPKPGGMGGPPKPMGGPKLDGGGARCCGPKPKPPAGGPPLDS